MKQKAKILFCSILAFLLLCSSCGKTPGQTSSVPVSSGSTVTENSTDSSADDPVLTALQIAEAMHLSRREIATLRSGAILHDIGKIGIGDVILNKPGALTDEERRDNQDAFQYDRARIMVATNAFGMGIDKSNVSYVIHYNMPQSLESYYQEAGRAGRDGEKAECLLLFGKQDIVTAKFFIRKTFEESELPEDEKLRNMEQDMKRLYKMIDYCETPGCLRLFLLSYFGQRMENRCENCGNCLALQPKKSKKNDTAPKLTGRMVTRDITKEAQMVMSCIRRLKTALGYSTTATITVRVLRGSRDKRILEMGLEELSTYGIMSAYSREEVREIISHLHSIGMVEMDKKEILTLNPAAKAVLFEAQAVSVTLDEGEMEARFPKSGTVTADSKLLTALKELRLRIAKEEAVPAYVVFSNATLADMEKRRPRTMAQFLQVSGVGEIKAQRYGESFLALLRSFDKKS